MKTKPSILVVCGRNKRRSKTAETIFRDSNEFSIKSVGLSPKSPSQISESQIVWADLIFVMEDGHKSRILDQFRHLALPEIAVLHIEDEYDYMDDELVEMLKEDISNVIKQEL